MPPKVHYLFEILYWCGIREFYEGTSYVDFDDFERIVKADTDLGYEVFIVDTFSKIKYDRKYNANDYNDTYEVMAK